jgi:hypothetical protein
MFSLLMSRPEAKREMSGLTLTQEASEKDQEGVARNSVVADFVEELRRRYERCKRRITIGGGPIKKSLEVNFVVAITVFVYKRRPVCKYPHSVHVYIHLYVYVYLFLYIPVSVGTDSDRNVGHIPDLTLITENFFSLKACYPESSF